MTRVRARSARIALVLAALAAAALLAVPTIAAACSGGDPAQGGSDSHGRPGYVGGHHHHHHWFPASEVGKVASYSAETGKLAITLKNGETVSGLVTEETFITCGDFDHDYRLRRHHHGDHGDWGGDWEGPSTGAGCDAESLVPGAVVNGALMHLGEGGAVFDAIFLAPIPKPVTPTPTPEA